jgi:formylglycine-generating enzyme required for sulfatase activity
MYLDKSMMARYRAEVSQIDPNEFTISTTSDFRKGPAYKDKDKFKKIRVCFGGNTESRQLYFGQLFRTEFSYVYNVDGIYASNSLIGFMGADVVVLCFEDEAEYLSWLTDGVELDFLLYNTPNSKRFFVTGKFASLLNLRELSDILDTEVNLLKRDSLESVRLEIGGSIPENHFVDSMVMVPTGSAPYQSEPTVVPKDARGMYFSGHITDTESCDVEGAVFYKCNRFVEDALNLEYGADPSKIVTIDKPFLVSQGEITQALYEPVMRSNPSRFKGRESFELQKEKDNPVDNVSWFDMIRFCNRLSQMQGFRPCYTIEYKRNRYGEYTDDIENVEWDRSANGYRLLTEKEWEYTARVNRTFGYSGSDAPSEVAWYGENSGHKTHPVGTKKENSFGTYDQSGNLFEWCWDLYRPDRPHRVLRGGGWGSGASYVRAANRSNGNPSSQLNYYGGRLARSPDPLIP